MFSKRLNQQFLPEEFHRMANKQPFRLALHEFDYAKFGRLDVVDQMCQNSKFELLDLSDCTVAASTAQLIESTVRSTESGKFRVK